MVAITGPAGAEVARATETDATPLILDYITGYEIALSAPCGRPAPTGPLTAHITFSAALAIDMPIGDFGPSCVGIGRPPSSLIAWRRIFEISQQYTKQYT